jgi:hypothetical protein
MSMGADDPIQITGAACPPLLYCLSISTASFQRSRSPRDTMTSSRPKHYSARAYIPTLLKLLTTHYTGKIENIHSTHKKMCGSGVCSRVCIFRVRASPFSISLCMKTGWQLWLSGSLALTINPCTVEEGPASHLFKIQEKWAFSLFVLARISA